MKNFSLISHQDSTEMVYYENHHITAVSYVPLDKGECITKSHLTHHIVMFVLKGSVEISCKHYEKEVIHKDHMTFLSKGGYMQVMALDEDAGLLFFGFDEITIRTNQSLIDYFSIHGNKHDYEYNSLPIKPSMKQIVDRIFTELRRGKIKDSIICQAWNIELFITFVHYYTKKEVTDFFRPLVSTNIDFKDFVENNYLEVQGQVDKLIRYSGMSAHLFKKAFLREFGMMPKAWLNQRFMQDIKHFAAQPAATTTYVASKLHITDVRLCQLCRKMFACTPQQLIVSLREES